MSEAVLTREAPASGLDRNVMRRLMLFFGVVYVVEGLGQTGGLIAQPLNYFLKEVHGWTAVQVTAFLTVFNLPWVIKPIYGLVSDFVPLFGYRRKSYLIIVNIAATLAFLFVTRVTEPGLLAFALLMTAYAMAISSTLCGGLLVENGQKFGASGKLVNQQWLWFNIASMAGSLGGGALLQWLSPTTALHTAAFVLALVPLALVVSAWRLVDEEKSEINIPALKQTFRSLLEALKSRRLWIVALFLFLYYFCPGFGTPLYYHMTDNLKFSQGFIGILGTLSSAGWIVGSFIFQRYLDGLSTRTLLNASIVLGTLTTLSYLLLSNEASAAILYFCSGAGAMLVTVASLTLAADCSPKRAEGFAFAVLMSITNLSSSASDNLGSYLYEHVFAHNLTPLILVAAAATAFGLVLMPMLRLGKASEKTAQEALAR